MRLMKGIALLITILTVLILVGCNNAKTNSQVDTATQLEENEDTETASTTLSNQTGQPDSITDSSTGIQSDNSSDHTETYDDETHKEIKYEKMSFSIGSYHIVSHTSSGNIETFECEIDKGKGYSWTKPHITITVRAIEKNDFPDTKSIVAYLSDRYPNYDKITIYNNIIDDSGIISFYVVSEGDERKYIVYFEDASYLIESANDEIYLLSSYKNYPSEYYEIFNQKVECANSNITNVIETVTYNEDECAKAEFVITQGKGGAKYFADLIRDEGLYYHFTIKDENDKQLLKLNTIGEFTDILEILDVNMDGYADIQILGEPGTLNNSYDLYVWDENDLNFVKVKCDEMLSEFEVHDGYLLNWQRDGADSGVVQKLIWKDNNTLIKESEEQYKADDEALPDDEY